MTLRAEDLGHKFGFGDGDLLDEVLVELGHADLDAHLVLCHLVVAHLWPLLGGRVGLRRVHSAHNPVRVRSVDGLVELDDDHSMPEELAWVTVEVGAAEIQAAVSAARGGEPDWGAVAGVTAADVATDGLAAWVGRRVEVTTADGSVLLGELHAAGDTVELAGTDDDVIEVSAGELRAVSVYQLSDTEWARVIEREETFTPTEVPGPAAARMPPGEQPALDSTLEDAAVFDTSSSWGLSLCWVPHPHTT